MPIINTLKISKDINVRVHEAGQISLYSKLLQAVVVLNKEEQAQVYEIIKNNLGLGE